MPVDLYTARGDALHDALRQAADLAPITVEPFTGSTVVLRHADIAALARDPRLAGVGLRLFDAMGVTDGPLREWYGALMFTNEGEVHDRLRMLVSRAFTPRSVEALRVAVGEEADSCLRTIVDDGGGDLVDAFRLLAMNAMCRLLGVPLQDVGVFAAWADALSPSFGFMDPQQIEAATTAITDLLVYVEDLAQRRRDDPSSDLITALLQAEQDGDRLTHVELVQMVANLLVGGHDTTSSQVGCSLLTLLRHRDEAARVRSDPDLLVSAVEETIRFEPSIIAVPRTAVAPLEVAGTELHPGAIVILCTAAANREPGVWTDPDRVDVGRFAVKGHPGLRSFGAGPHFCLGAALARMTLQESVRAFVSTGEVLSLACDPDEVAWRSVLGRSPAALPVVA